MEESKLKRVVAAATVTAVLLLVILVFTAIYQITSLISLKKEKKALNEQIKILEDLNSANESAIESRLTEEWIINKAREYGWHFEDDKLILEDGTSVDVDL